MASSPAAPAEAPELPEPPEAPEPLGSPGAPGPPEPPEPPHAYPSARPSPRGVMRYGDPVVLMLSYDTLLYDVLREGASFVTNFGAFEHAELVGRPFGSKVFSRSDRGYCFALRFSLRLWAQVLTRRTQILFSPDISVVVARTALRPGAVVYEAGTGSGNLTHTLVAAVYPNGRVHTFDVNPERPALARDEIVRNLAGACRLGAGAGAGAGVLADVVAASCRDVCAEGFPDECPPANLIFLDMPAPEAALRGGRCSRRLVPGGFLVVFVPCIEQVHRALAVLAADAAMGGFVTVKTHAQAYDLDSPTLPAPPLRHAPAARGHPRVPAGAFLDRTPVTGLRPRPVMRLHTGYLLFSQRTN